MHVKHVTRVADSRRRKRVGNGEFLFVSREHRIMKEREKLERDKEFSRPVVIMYRKLRRTQPFGPEVQDQILAAKKPRHPPPPP